MDWNLWLSYTVIKRNPFSGSGARFVPDPIPTGSEWYESVVAVAEFEGDEVVEIRLYPIEHLPGLSAPFGTR